MIILYILLALVVLLFMVMIHELGHYTMGKLFKFKINEFSIGFGKAIIKKTNKKTGEVFSIRMIPLGGFCAFEGENGGSEVQGAFSRQKPWKRIVVLMAGGVFNIIFGFFMCAIMLWSFGYGAQKIVSTTEQNAGTILANDIIYEVDGTDLSPIGKGISQLLLGKKDGETVVLTIKRDGKKQEIEAVVKIVTELDEAGNPYERVVLGVQSEQYKYGFWEGLGSMFKVTWDIIWETLKAIFNLFTGKIGIKDLSGPFGTIGAMAQGTMARFSFLFLLIPLITINLGLFNLLPIPALDGGRIVFVVIEAIRRKPVNPKVEATIHGIGLIILFSFVILVDVIKLFL